MIHDNNTLSVYNFWQNSCVYKRVHDIKSVVSQTETVSKISFIRTQQLKKEIISKSIYRTSSPCWNSSISSLRFSQGQKLLQWSDRNRLACLVDNKLSCYSRKQRD